MSEQSSHADDEFEDVLDQLADAVEETGGGESESDDDSSERSEAKTEQSRTDPNGEIDVRGARDVGRNLAEKLTGSPLDGIIEVEDLDEEGWRVIVEVVERSSIPDTQDILGRYVISLDDRGTVRGYGRAGRYRRAGFSQQREVIAADERGGYS